MPRIPFAPPPTVPPGRPLRQALLALLTLLGGGLALAAPTTVPAAQGDWQRDAIGPEIAVEARLIAAVDGVGLMEEVPAGLQVRLPEGWKTYWRSPGDAGLPPVLDWQGSGNVADMRFDYPAPHRFELFGLETFGYEHEVVYPLTLTPVRTGEALALRARADLLVCADICVPARFDLALDIPAGPPLADADAAMLINRFAAQVPGDGAATGLAIAEVAEVPDGARSALRVVASADDIPFQRPDVFVETADYWVFGRPTQRLEANGGRAVFHVPILEGPNGDAVLTGGSVTLTLVDGGRAMEVDATVRAGVAEATGRPWAALLPILGFAVLGGLILNLMPCVLPVLSLKLLSVVSQGGKTARQVRIGFLASAAGILASFLALAGGAIALKLAGGAVGWGIQFQQPMFLVFMVVVLTLFAANLLGLFEISLPGRLADVAVQAGSDAGGRPRDSLGGHFATGAFATLLATPCSAPFLGTAVGFALSRGTVEILLVFLALGLGLALPYLLVALAPGLATRMPRPGPWMITLKRVLALALLATAAWLLTVMAVQTQPLAALAVAGLMAGLAALLWGRGRLDGRQRLASSAAAGLIVLAAFALPGQFEAERTAVTAGAAAWTPFERAAIVEQVALGQVVFVDVTADWCITCQANKLRVLDRGIVAERLADDAVIAMRADWTRPDARIAAYLASHGRYGIPFNAVYGPGAPDGIALPELLTERAVLEALDRAAREPD